MAEELKKHPAVWEGERDISTRKEMVPFLAKVKDAVWQDGFDRSDWEVKQEHFYNVRYAFLENEVDWPWPGAADIMVPMSDMLIDRIKPGLIGLFSNVSPVVSFEELLGSREANQARFAEYTMEYLLKIRDPNAVFEYAKAIDNTLSIGFGIIHPQYVYQTELQRLVIHKKKLPAPLNGFVVLQKGTMAQADLLYQASGGKIRAITKEVFDRMKEPIREKVREAWNLFESDPIDRRAIDKIMEFLRGPQEIVEVSVRQEVKNTSTFVSLDPFDVWVPTYTKRLENANRVTVRLDLTQVEIERRMRDENWAREPVEQLLEGPPSGIASGAGKSSYFAFRNIEEIRREREGVSATTRRRDDTYEVFATYCWMPIYGEKELSRGVVVWSPYLEKPLKAAPLANNHGKWPFVQTRFEANDDRYYSSRGIPEKIADLENEETWQVREYLNNLRIMNAPTFMYEEMTNFNPNDIPWTPGQFVKVGRVDRVAPLSAPDRTISIERMSLLLRNFIEQYVGSPDLALSGAGGSKDPRTATEIDAINQLTQVAGGYHSQVTQWSMKEVYRQVWSNWVQWGPDRFNVRISGKETVRLTKQDVMGDFEIVPRGTAGNVNPSIEARKALQRLSTLVQMKPLLDSDPNAQFSPNIPEAIREYLEKDDFAAAKRLLRELSPQEMQAKQAQIAQAQQAQQAAQGQLPQGQQRGAPRGNQPALQAIPTALTG